MVCVILRYCVLFCLFILVGMSKRYSGPAPRGGIPGPCSLLKSRTACALPNENCVPSNEVCAPKKVTGSVLLEWRSRPETPKILVITAEFMGKNHFFADFAVKTFFFHPIIRGISRMLRDENLCFWSSLSTKFLCPPN